MEWQPEHSGLCAPRETMKYSDIEIWRRGTRAIALNDLDQPHLLDYKNPAAAIVRLLDVEWLREACCDRDQVKLGWTRARARSRPRRRRRTAAARQIRTNKHCDE